MKFTSKDLMKPMGLKVGDKIKIFNNKFDKICTLIETETGYYLIGEENNCYPLISLMNVDYEILPQPKRVGDLKCNAHCRRCPIRSVCNGTVGKLDSECTLYQHLESYKDINIYFDQEIYDILKTRLDKEMIENA